MTRTLPHFVRAAVLLAAASPAFAQWSQRFPAAAPDAGTWPAMTFDANRGELLLFGGLTLGFAISNATWTYDGTQWTRLITATSPPHRYLAQIVHDTARGVTVLHGGATTLHGMPPVLDDTWEFDGATWTQANPVANAGARYSHSACYDSGRSRMVRYGGVPAVSSPPGNETWEYDGTTWTQIPTVGDPGPTAGAAMCFHAGIGKAVLFGGTSSLALPSAVSDETWLFDGTAATWTQVVIAGSKPSARYDATMVYDSERNLCVLVGGSDAAGALQNDTWTFDGTQWLQQPVATQSMPHPAFAFLPTTGQAVRFGFHLAAGTPPPLPTIQTWEIGAGILGSGCPGTNGVPSLTNANAPRLGQSYTLHLTNLNPTPPVAILVFGFTQLPGIDLSFLPMPGCLAFTTPDILIGVAGSGASASWTWPSVSGTVGDAIYCQALCLDPVNGFGFTASNAVYLTIGS